MLFNSFTFLFFFLPLVWVLFRLAAHLRWPRVAIGVLVLGSLGFYGYASPWAVVLLLGSAGFNFWWGQRVARAGPDARGPIALGVAANLGLLAYFKYTNFLLGTVGALVGAEWQIESLLPMLGISFFTFQQVAYLVDRHRGKVPEHDLLHYLLFVCFFPKLIAGPILLHTEVLPQLSNPDDFKLCARNLYLGASIFILGLFKKIWIADTLAPWATALFDGTEDPTMVAAWLGSLAYTFQIYFDFSGYSDMALGLGRMFNLDIPVNFDAPYKSTSVREFWRRWHISLSRFLRDYLYIPLGGNRHGRLRQYGNLLLTMLLAGLWHGAAWTFVFWGGLHGLYLVINHAWRSLGERAPVRLPTAVSWLLTFLAVHVAWVFFRAPSFERAWQVLGAMAGEFETGWEALALPGWETAKALFSFQVDAQLGAALALLAMVLWLPTAWDWVREGQLKRPVAWPVALGLLFVFSVLVLTQVTTFLYFQF